MIRFIAGLKREWQQILSQPSYWAALFVLPLVAFVSVIGVVATPSVNSVPMDIIDLDQSSASRDIAFRLNASAAVSIQSTLKDSKHALTRTQNKESFGYLVIPENFQRDLITGQTVAINAYVNQQSFMLGNILSNQVLRNIIESSLKESARQLMVGGQIKEQALANVYPLRPVRSVWGNSYLNYQTFLLASLLPHLWHVIVMMVTVIALGKEFKDGTVGEWIKLSNHHMSLALTSKLLIPAIVMGLWITAIDVFIFWQTNASQHASLSSLLITSWLTQFSYHCAGFLAVAITHNYRRSLSVAAFYTTPAFAFVGVTFPTFNMNWLSQLWQTLLPISVLMQVQNDILNWQKNIFDVWPDLVLVAVYALAFGILAMMIIRPKLTQPKLWHQH